MTHHLPGPGDPETWPASTAHPNDPRYDGPWEEEATLECGMLATHVVVPVAVWDAVTERLDEVTREWADDASTSAEMTCAFNDEVTWRDGYADCPWCGREHYDDGDWT